MDYIRLKNLVFHNYHGLRPDEAVQGQRFEVDVEVGCDLQSAGLSDNLAETIDYEWIYQITAEIMSGARRYLLEALAQSIADRIIGAYPSVQVRVTVRKPNALLLGIHAGAEVEVNRSA
ncbi:MAG: dihydroneopterin aldolase [Calditrichaeota bacterium]|nr:dihydroneopterin aldolase [Calditrichota bacterium]